MLFLSRWLSHASCLFFASYCLIVFGKKPLDYYSQCEGGDYFTNDQQFLNWMLIVTRKESFQLVHQTLSIIFGIADYHHHDMVAHNFRFWFLNFSSHIVTDLELYVEISNVFFFPPDDDYDVSFSLFMVCLKKNYWQIVKVEAICPLIFCSYIHSFILFCSTIWTFCFLYNLLWVIDCRHCSSNNFSIIFFALFQWKILFQHILFVFLSEFSTIQSCTHTHTHTRTHSLFWIKNSLLSSIVHVFRFKFLYIEQKVCSIHHAFSCERREKLTKEYWKTGETSGDWTIEIRSVSFFFEKKWKNKNIGLKRRSSLFGFFCERRRNILYKKSRCSSSLMYQESESKQIMNGYHLFLQENHDSFYIKNRLFFSMGFSM